MDERDTQPLSSLHKEKQKDKDEDKEGGFKKKKCNNGWFQADEDASSQNPQTKRTKVNSEFDQNMLLKIS